MRYCFGRNITERFHWWMKFTAYIGISIVILTGLIMTCVMWSHQNDNIYDKRVFDAGVTLMLVGIVFGAFAIFMFCTCSETFHEDFVYN